VLATVYCQLSELNYFLNKKLFSHKAKIKACVDFQAKIQFWGIVQKRFKSTSPNITLVQWGQVTEILMK